MKNKLIQLRWQYNNARSILGTLTKLKSPPKRISAALSRLNKTRGKLLREMKRVAWLLWPETGRPYTGLWEVQSIISEKGLFQGSMLDCIEFMNRFSYGKHHTIRQFGQ